MEPARAAQPDFKPHLFGKFFLLQRLAIGGMAEIYRAKVVGAAGFEKELAVKRVLAARAQNPGFIQMLVNEAKLSAQLAHSNIAQIYECGEFDGTYFIAMELVYGVSMKEMMAAFARSGTALSPEQAIFLVLQLLQGLDYAHRKTDALGEPLKIVHCDVSPDNALISWEGELKLLDFGIARAATGLSNYKEGMLMGKLGYVAPEQASVEKTWDHRVDLFAAGIILYELLTGQKPFPKATDVESLVASRKAKVPAPSVLDDRIPKELDVILARALALNPDGRYASARAFADALVDVLFPTPHSSLQELLGEQMRRVFVERIQRQRAARAHDALVLKVLQNVVEGPPRPQAVAASQPLARAREPEGPPELDARALSPARPKRPRAAGRAGPSAMKAAALALLLAALAAGATYAGELWLRPGVLVVTSDPPAAQVSVDGQLRPERTPAVIDRVALSRAVALSVAAKDHKTVSLILEPHIGELVRRVHVNLPPALGPLSVDSQPRGAHVRLDDREVGETPVTIEGVRLDEPHRLDLSLPGLELDQFVVLPERDGQHFLRTLTQSRHPPARPREPDPPR
ncbi:MAG TPA: serine/threonine-protein kinase [Anaeromyxobacteraceae bacterium]|nr:serine/threonine-protein kinase [Anaeromyxobacteraceae bacterium]